MAELLHGEQLAFIFLLVALTVLAVLVVVCVWLTRRLKQRVGKYAYLVPVVMLSAVVAGGYLLFPSPYEYSGPPQALLGSKVGQFTKDLSTYAPFAYSGLAFFKGKLYSATNIGLLEIEDGKVSKVYRVQKEHSVVSGPWVDSANQLLWILDEQTQQFLKFDGVKWERISKPVPEKGYYSRGDVLGGIHAVDDGRTLWIHTGGTGWQWDPNKKSWSLVPGPPRVLSENQVDEPIGILTVAERVTFLVRHEALWFTFEEGEEFRSDTLMILDGGWHQIPANGSVRFFAETWAVAGGNGYICTKEGVVLEITVDAVTKLNAPGECETLARTEAGTLVVSIRSKGIYEYGAGWKHLVEHPYASGSGEYWAHLAVAGTQIAYATHGQPVLDQERSTENEMKWLRNAPTVLWVLGDGVFEKVEVADHEN